MRVSRRSLCVTVACAGLAAVVVIWTVSLAAGVDDRSDRVVEVYARQMEYPADEGWVRQEALEWSGYVCSMTVDDEGSFVGGTTSTIDDLIEIAEAGCPEKAEEMKAWKAANPEEPPDSALDCTVTEESAGDEILVGTVTSRFDICLDDEIHPLEDLRTDGCPFGYVSGYAVNGPDRYPIGFEVTRAGSCTVTNGDFRVTILSAGDEEAPVADQAARRLGVQPAASRRRSSPESP